MVSCRSLLLSTLTVGATVFGVSLTAYAEWPSEADKTNVTNSFTYEYTLSDGNGQYSGFQRSNAKVLSNRWISLDTNFSRYENYSGEIIYEHEYNPYLLELYVDCSTSEFHQKGAYPENIELNEYSGKTWTVNWALNTETWIYSVDGIVEDEYTLTPEEIANILRAYSELCQQANLSNGFSSASVAPSTSSPSPASTPEFSSTTNFQVAQHYVAPTTANSLSNAGQLMAQEDQPELATAYLKGAIEEYEQARLDPNAPQPTREEVERAYQLLATTLLDQDRTIEAQETLDSFTVWELAHYFDISAPRTEMQISQQPEAQTYAQAKAVPASPTDSKPNHIASAGLSSSAPVTILQAERDILVAHNADQAGAMASGIELAKLLEIEPDQRTAAQNDRIQQLKALENDINRDFNSFIGRPDIKTRVEEISEKSKQQRTVDPNEFNPLRNKLAQLNAAVVYPLILEDRIELIITTSQTAPLRRTVFVDQDEVLSTISAFRRGLIRRGNLAQLLPRAQQLHQWLIDPIEDELEAAGVKSILYAPYGQLRYIPLTALHDGNQWLVEKYGVNTITALSLQELTAQRKADPRVLAAAFADKDTEYTVPLGDLTTTMSGLPFAGREVELLTAERNNHTLLVDQDFSLGSVLPIMGNFDVIHFATHAAFIPGKPENSFILFGNGDRATLADIANWVLPNVQMAVLSACQTGFGRVLDSGIEILGLGYQFHKVGAHSVMASLWRVDDGGTQVLMNTFYNNLDQGMTKTEALQAAQVAMLKGDATTLGDTRGGLGFDFTDSLEFGGQQGGLSHPFYWSPFITIGNGL